MRGPKGSSPVSVFIVLIEEMFKKIIMFQKVFWNIPTEKVKLIFRICVNTQNSSPFSVLFNNS